MELDAFDKAILRLVQRDARLSHEAIGEQVSLSASAVRRRLKAMREAGLIAREVAILEPDAAGFRVVVLVRCETESAEVYDRFKRRMRACEDVLECYSVSGDHDFIVIAHMPDMAAYNAWLQDYVIGDEGLNRCDSAFVFETVKYDTARRVD